MTAAHVLDAASSILELHNQNDFGLFAGYASNEGQHNHLGGLWPIDRIFIQDEIDIALCRLRSALHKPSGKLMRWKPVALSPGLPNRGQYIYAFGYRAMSVPRFERNTDGLMELTFRVCTSASSGHIVEIFEERRDHSFLRYPSFQTNARYDHGMSGGPILNQAGMVCGVITSSHKFESGDAEHVSYGSLIWPAMGIELEHRGKSVRLLDLVSIKQIHTDESIRDVIVLSRSETRIELAIRY
jgi:hypothetical protein